MATAEFNAALVADCCVAEIAHQESRMAEANERAIVELMERPVPGYWPWSKTHMRSREEAEDHYGRSEYWYSSRWWTERPYRNRIANINAILKLAKSENKGLLRLDEEEASLIGVTDKEAA